jgi:lipopolysaccharide biosynthesis glycosyltransferase
MDLARWRVQGLGERALAFARSAEEPLLWADMDALNAVVTDWHELDLRWNVFSREPFDLNRAAVVHFAGYPKPWHPWYAAPGAMLWARALRRSGWYTPTEWISWWVPWLGKGAVDAGRRAMAARSRSTGRREDDPG